MDRYLQKLVLLLGACVLAAALMLLTNSGKGLPGGGAAQGPGRIRLLDTAVPAMAQAGEESGQATALILYSPGYDGSVKYKDNLCIVLRHLCITARTLPLADNETVSYSDYDYVLLASGHWESELSDSSLRLMEYVAGGGRLFFGMLPEDVGPQFRSAYRQMGIADYGDYLSIDTLDFEAELLPGLAGQCFSGLEFDDVALSLTLEPEARVYAWAGKGQETRTPLIWTFQNGQGRVAVCNATGITGDYWRGIAAGCINALTDTALYPVVNALCIFIDDFPSPQYESESDVVREEYGRSAREFYRDIWWPDMLKIAKAYGDIYTGLFVATYDNIVDPEAFAFTPLSTEQYFGNSLLKNGYEMGAHGYNHQSLTLAGGSPPEMGYVPWADGADMAASLRELVTITEELFPSVRLACYVPPSNYLSAQGRQAVVAALPELKVISGVYTDEGEEGDVYKQDFSIADDGVAEFPRVTSGMMPGDFDRFTAFSALGLHGVVSHFIHPDDIFDAERGYGQNWQTLYRAYCQWMADIHTAAPYLRALSASEASDALRIAESARLRLTRTPEGLECHIDGFLGQTCFFLRSEYTPRAQDGACTIQRIGPGDGALYYLVTANEPDFSIKLVKDA